MPDLLYDDPDRWYWYGRLIALPEEAKAHRMEAYKVGLWVDKAGNVQYIERLEEKHLRAILSFLVRWARAAVKADLLFYLHTPGPQGEMAQVAFEEELGLVTELALQPDGWQVILVTHPFYAWLRQDFNRRGLAWPGGLPEPQDDADVEAQIWNAVLGHDGQG